jgi:hypothetical protein
MSSDPARLTALGNQLIAVHIRLRDELDRLLDDLEAGERPRELRAHCLAFCSALDRHHTGEDGGLFPVLAAEHPELREVLELLQRDHDVVAGILRSIEDVLDRARPPRAGRPRRDPRIPLRLRGAQARHRPERAGRGRRASRHRGRVHALISAPPA